MVSRRQEAQGCQEANALYLERGVSFSSVQGSPPLGDR